MTVNHRDEFFMRQTFRLAKRGEGYVSPNPLVGSVVVRNDKVIAKGWHQKYGQPHAEAIALKAAGAKAKGATLYVNLEPCCHWGKNPPCTDQIIKSGITRVVFCNKDPNPKVIACNSEATLRAVGIEVVAGVLEAEGLQLNKVFFTYISTKNPFITLKLGATLDGKIADRYHGSKWITNEVSRAYVHHLRFHHDAIMVGVGTIIQDDPQLNVRLPRKTKENIRIIIDRDLEIPLSARVFKQPGQVVVIAQKMFEESDKARSIEKNGAELIFLPLKNHQFEWAALYQELGKRSITSVLIEGGSRLAYGVMSSRSFDELIVFIAPKVLADNNALPIFNGESQWQINKLKPLRLKHVKQFGDDVCLTYQP